MIIADMVDARLVAVIGSRRQTDFVRRGRLMAAFENLLVISAQAVKPLRHLCRWARLSFS